MIEPGATYARLRGERSAAVAAADARFGVVSNLRVACFLGAVGTGWWLHATGRDLVWVLPFVAGFVALLVLHDRVQRSRMKASKAVAYYARGERRLDGDWLGVGDEGTAYVPAEHPCAFDVDAFGRGSLFQLLADTRTMAGDLTLAGWLLHPAKIHEIRARQAAVAELLPEVELRERLCLRADESRGELELGELTLWSKRALTLQGTRTRLVVRALCAAAIASTIAWLGFGASFIPLLVVAALGGLLTRSIEGDVKAVTTRISKARIELAALVHVLRTFAGRTATSPWLAARYESYAGAELALGRLIRLIDWLEARRNQIFAPIAWLLQWTPQLAFAIEDWRARYGRDVLEWIRAAGELEAMSALSRHAFEHPADPFPELVEGEVPLLIAEEVRHPLMREDRCVANSVSFEAPLQLLLVSGSNMSGKSTLLRTLGLNVVLALMGAPVRARRFALSPLQIAATLRVQDSLQDGASRFYAEIARLKTVADCAAQGPTLFLLDEILSGTNSHDRRIGTEAVVRSLLGRRAIGLVTTHDLALTEIVTTLGDAATNVHFEDQMTGTTLAFDYTMRPGVVRKSNAIALMRAVGLEV